jgi:hypothetical protein
MESGGMVICREEIKYLEKTCPNTTSPQIPLTFNILLLCEISGSHGGRYEVLESSGLYCHVAK